MPISAKQLLKAVLILAATSPGLLWGSTLAAEPDAAATSPYRLVMLPLEYSRVANVEPYRLTSPRRALQAALADLPYSNEIGVAARNAEIDPALLHAVIHVESRHQAYALSPRGAMGLMQVMPETGARFGVPHPDRSVAGNLKAGTLYLRSLMQQFDGRIDLALAAYNAGEGAVLRHSMAIPPYPETRRYVPAVLAKYEEWRIAENPTRPIDYLPGTRMIAKR